MGRSTLAVYLRQPGEGWPVDDGDDPSFKHARAKGGRVTWGVCRTTLRNALRTGDLVVFFAADRLTDRSPARYYWVGFATVESTVSRTDIFERRELRGYRDYPNLLIQQSTGSRGAYEHSEPTLTKQKWHRDWLWRLVKTRTRKAAYMKACLSDQYDPKRTRVDGLPVALGPNYIIFAAERTGTWIAANPPVVATASASGRTEKWLATPLARELRAVLLGGRRASRTKLRTTNAQRAHPHIRLRVEPEELRAELEELSRRHGLPGAKKLLPNTHTGRHTEAKGRR